jgi:hypothetical protein
VSQNQPVRTDLDARRALDRLSRASRERDGALALEAADMVCELVRVGYVLFPLADPGEVAAKPVRMRSKYEGACAACDQPIAVGEFIYWTRGKQGIECADCGGQS